MHTQKSNPSWASLTKYAKTCGFELMLQPVKVGG